MEAERERCALGGVLALISGNQLRLMGGQERLYGLLRAALGGLTSGKRPRERTIFSEDMALRGIGRIRAYPSGWHPYPPIQAPGTLLHPSPPRLSAWHPFLSPLSPSPAAPSPFPSPGDSLLSLHPDTLVQTATWRKASKTDSLGPGG